jgi:hypothetical protein
LQGKDEIMTIRKDFLIAAGAALMFALPAALQAQADQPAPPPAAGQPAPMPEPAAAASQSAAAAAAPAPPADSGATKDYPRCSKTVTDSCVQSEGGSQSKAHRSKSSHRKKS